MRPALRSPAAGGLAALLLVVGAGVARAAWTDTSSVTGASTTAASLPTPTISCEQRSLTTVRLTWLAQTTPSTVTWVATVNGQVLSGMSGNQIDVSGSLLSSLGLLGGSRTVTVTGTLPSTSWTTQVPGTIVLTTVVLGLLVTCP